MFVLAEIVALVAYLACGAALVRAVMTGAEATALGQRLAVVGLVAHGVGFASFVVVGDRSPGFDTSLSAVAFGVMAVVAGLASGRLAALATALAPTGAAILAAALVAPATTVSALAEAGGSWWLPIHLALVFAAMASFALEFVAAAFEATVRRRLKAKRLDALGRLPALDLLVAVQQRALVLGLVSLAGGVAVGAGGASGVASAAGWLLSTKVLFTLGVWAWYAGMLAVRQRWGWHGRWSVVASTVGISALVFSLIGLDFVAGGFHSYGG